MPRIAAFFLLAVCLARLVWAHDHPDIVPAQFVSQHANITGTLMLPHLEADEKAPCLLLVGGANSDLRDGGSDRLGAPPRTALKRLAEQLVVGGYASLRYDKAGHGASRAHEGWTNSYRQQSNVVAMALAWLRRRSEIGRIVIAGEGRGGYLACLAAENGAVADAYLFLNPICGPAEELFAHNAGRLAKYVDSDLSHAAWSQQFNLRMQLALGRHYPSLLAAAAAGKQTFEIVDGERRFTLPLGHFQEELEKPPQTMFGLIRSPALVLVGELDLHVPPHHAERAVEAMRAAGNRQATRLVIEGADHHFQQAAGDAMARLRERHSGQSLRRPYAPRFYRELLAWLHVEVPTPAEGRTHVHGNGD